MPSKVETYRKPSHRGGYYSHFSLVFFPDDVSKVVGTKSPCLTSSHILLRLSLLARALDDMRQVTNGELEGEIEGSEQNGEEDPPAQQVHDEGQRAGGDLSHVIKGASEKRKAQQDMA